MTGIDFCYSRVNHRWVIMVYTSTESGNEMIDSFQCTRKDLASTISELTSSYNVTQIDKLPIGSMD